MKPNYSQLIVELLLLCVSATASAQVPPGMTMTRMDPPTDLEDAIPLYKWRCAWLGERQTE